MYIYFILLCSLLVLSCQLSPEDPIEKLIEQTNSSQESDISKDSLSELQPAWSIEFCEDSIYTSYLRKQQQAENNRVYKSARSRRNHEHKLRYEQREKLGRLELASSIPSLPIVQNSQIERWIQYYQTKGKITFLKWLVRRESYRHIIVPILREEGVPIELEFLAMVESGFSNIAYSRARATGTWQFMAPTARLYGLEVNFWVDERRNIEKSTRAAARYLKDLYRRFDSWYLAFAAYNAGPSRVARAMRKLKTNDFWTIAQSRRYLRLETRQYVPKILAALYIASEPYRYGFNTSHNLKHFIPSEQIVIDRPALLTDISDKLTIPSKLLKRWNPELSRGVTPPASKTSSSVYKLRLPKAYHQDFANISNQLVDLKISDFKLHKIRSGETLSKIAKRYAVSVKKIQKLNPRLRPRRMRPGLKIAIPVPSVSKVL